MPMPSRNLKPFLAYLAPQEHAKLKKFAAKHTMPMTQVIREAISARIAGGDPYVIGFNAGLQEAIDAVNAMQHAKMRFPSGESFAEIVEAEVTKQMIRGVRKAAPAKKAAAKKSPESEKTRKVPRKPSATLKPSAALAALIGPEAVARTDVIKKLWDYIKANGLQDATNKRAINADDKLRVVFGKPQVTMFELAGIVSKHLESGC
jgi:hypothetical protein